VQAANGCSALLSFADEDVHIDGLRTTPVYAADPVVLLASRRADALTGRFVTINDNVVGLLERAGSEGVGDLQTRR